MNVASHLEKERRWLLLEGVGLVNFLSFFLIALLIGGSADLGKMTVQGYFVGDHGRLTEVSAFTYWYSWIHTLSQAITFPLGGYGAFRRFMRRRRWI